MSAISGNMAVIASAAWQAPHGTESAAQITKCFDGSSTDQHGAFIASGLIVMGIDDISS